MSSDGRSITLRCLQGWKGSISLHPDANLEEFIASLLREASPTITQRGDILSFIVKGKRIELATCEDSAACASLGMSDGAAVMVVLRSADERAALAATEQRLAKLRQVERAAEALASRVGIGTIGGLMGTSSRSLTSY